MKNLNIIVFVYMLACFSITCMAKDEKVKILAKSSIELEPVPVDFQLDEQTNAQAMSWPIIRGKSVNKTCWIDDVAQEPNITNYFPKIRLSPMGDSTPSAWMLTEEDNQTVLHCYLKMPSDEVTNLYLADENTLILDKETGVRYQSIRTVPNVYGKHFGIRAKKDSFIDLKIYFPILPKKTRKIVIYGVENWHLNGNLPYEHEQWYEIATHDILLDRGDDKPVHYDALPVFQTPKLVKAEEDYDPQKRSTWAVYGNLQLIKPCPDGTMALWRTPTATYVALSCEAYSEASFVYSSSISLIDQEGNFYKCVDIQGLPTNRIFRIGGKPGDYIAFLLKFPPISEKAKVVDYIEYRGRACDGWQDNWEGDAHLNLNVEELRANQKYFKFFERKIVK